MRSQAREKLGLTRDGSISASFVPDPLAANADNEIASPPLDELDRRDVESLVDGSGQPGRVRAVVSNRAVFDGQVHPAQG